MKGRDKRRRAKMRRADEPKATAVSRGGAELAENTKVNRVVINHPRGAGKTTAAKEA
jgi:hypothetical protein